MEFAYHALMQCIIYITDFVEVYYHQQFAVQTYKDQNTQNYNCTFFVCVCEVWAVTLRKEHRLGLFENRVPRGIFWAEGIRGKRGVEKTK